MIAWLSSIPWARGFYNAGVVGVVLSVVVLVLAVRTMGDDRPWTDGKDTAKGALCFVAYLLLLSFMMGLFPLGDE